MGACRSLQRAAWPSRWKTDNELYPDQRARRRNPRVLFFFYDVGSSVPSTPHGTEYTVSLVATIISPARVKHNPTTLLPATKCPADSPSEAIRTTPWRP